MANLYDTGYRGYLYAASKDICAIEDLSARFDVNVESICFHAAQAAEKMVKQVFVDNKADPPWNHDVRSFLRKAMNNGWLEVTDEELSDSLDFKFFSTAGKYEMEPDITRAEALEAIAACNKISKMLERNGYIGLQINIPALFLHDQSLDRVEEIGFDIRDIGSLSMGTRDTEIADGKTNPDTHHSNPER